MPPTVTYLTPPALSSLPAESGQLEYSSRAMVFPRDGGGILRAWGDPNHPWVLRVDPAGSRWRITAWGVDAPQARRAARTMFSLNDPLAEFYRAAGREGVLRGTPRRFRGLRIPRDGSLYESLVHAVIGQQLSVAVAATMERRLVALAGATLRADGIDVPFLPGPRRYLALRPEELDTVGLSRAKRLALDGIARRAVAKAFDRPAEFLGADREAAIERLDVLPGVGRWTAENALLRGVGRRDVFLAGDLGIRVALASYGVLPRDAPEEAAREWGDRWYPGWGSYATLYLWRKWVADGTPRPVNPSRPSGPSRGADGRPRKDRVGSRRGGSPRRAGSRS